MRVRGSWGDEVDLTAMARLVFGGDDADDAGLRAVRAGQILAHAGGDADMAFFLIAWGVERVTAQRIASGDLGIDEASAAEYQMLADEITLDSFAEVREFDMAKLYAARRDEYARRNSAGRQRLLACHAEPLPLSA